MKLNNDFRLILNKDCILKEIENQHVRNSMVPQSVVCETMFMRLNDIIAYCKTLVRSGILQSDSASQLPMNPLEIRDLFGLIIRVDSDGLTMRDIEG
jgi:hypothetical protein